MDIIEISKRVASRAHNGQFRRDGYTPYINHPAAVAAKLVGESAVVVATAWLHDVLEDTTETPETLRAAGLPDSVIHAVEMLTKTKGESYEEYLLGVHQNWIAKKVKIADIIHNLGYAPTERQMIKYAKGLLTLLK